MKNKKNPKNPIKEKINEFDKAIHELENIAALLEAQKKKFVFEQIKSYLLSNNLSEEDLGIGNWECSKSIIEQCIFDIKNDPCKDFCLFCGEPDERK